MCRCSNSSWQSTLCSNSLQINTLHLHHIAILWGKHSHKASPAVRRRSRCSPAQHPCGRRALPCARHSVWRCGSQLPSWSRNTDRGNKPPNQSQAAAGGESTATQSVQRRQPERSQDLLASREGLIPAVAQLSAGAGAAHLAPSNPDGSQPGKGMTCAKRNRLPLCQGELCLERGQTFPGGARGESGRSSVLRRVISIPCSSWFSLWGGLLLQKTNTTTITVLKWVWTTRMIKPIKNCTNFLTE